MTRVNMIPDTPTKAPDTTKALLDIINPAILVENPDRLFKKEMDTGMSPPPMAITATIPYILARPATMTIKAMPKSRSFQSCPPVNAIVPNTAMAANIITVTRARNGTTLGLDEINPCNLPHATILSRQG